MKKLENYKSKAWRNFDVINYLKKTCCIMLQNIQQNIIQKTFVMICHLLKFTSCVQDDLLAAVADVDAMIIRSDIVDQEKETATKHIFFANYIQYLSVQ